MLSAGYHLSAQENLVQNGGFELGNTGFESAYTFSNNREAIGAGEYYIHHDASMLRYQWKATGEGNFMIVDGADKGTPYFWKESIGVKQKKNYLFRFSITALYNTGTYSRAQIGIFVNDKLVSTITSPTIENYWEEEELVIRNTTTDNMQIRMQVMNPTWGGNDFAIDNISLTLIKGQVKTRPVNKKPAPLPKEKPDTTDVPKIMNVDLPTETTGNSGVTTYSYPGIIYFTSSRLNEQVTIVAQSDLVFSIENSSNEKLYENVKATAGKEISFNVDLKKTENSYYLLSHTDKNVTILITIGTRSQSIELKAMQRGGFLIRR